MTKFLERALRTNQVEINTDEKTSRAVAKLKEPRELFPGSGEPSELPRQAARWPAECQVVVDRIRHLIWNPPQPEPYYKASGREIQPRPVGDQQGTVLFHYCPASHVNYFSRAVTGGTRPPSYDVLSPGCQMSSRCAAGPGLIDGASPDDLRFESRFESGNLGKAVKITDTYYELSIRHDLYTNRHMQWFYFRVENMRPGIQYRFSIVNLCKAESLYRCGMRPLLYSEREAALRGIGWRRCGANIAYYRNEYGTNGSGLITNGEANDDEEFPSYTLTFCVEFPHSGDKAYIANCYPYTYTDLQDDLLDLQNHPVKSRFCKLRLLCRSLAGNNVYYLTVTAPSIPEDVRRKKAVVLTARVHPGETPSSWMMKGFIDFLTGESNQARYLRDQFIFKLVPMLNPDGVIVGNSRCSLTGRDLNRQYRTVIRETYPSVWYTKLLVRRLLEDCGVEMYCDLHAHSRKHNIFIYGCENRRQGEQRLQEQVFPLMLHKNASEKFSFENCKFRIERSKEGTGRVVVWLMGVANAFTMEASFGGSDLPGVRQRTHFSQHDYQSMARNFCETLIDYCDLEPNKERLRMKIMNRLLKEGSNSDEPVNIELSDYSSDEGETSCSSEEVPWIEFTNPLPPVPPPSPALVRRIKTKDKHQWDKSQPRTRKPLRVHTTKLEPEIDGNILSVDSSNELSPNTRRRRLWEAQALRGGSPDPMPPELIVSSCSDQTTTLTKKRGKHKRKNASRWHSKLMSVKASPDEDAPAVPSPHRLNSVWLPRLSHAPPPPPPQPQLPFLCYETLLASCSHKLSSIRLHRGLAVRRDRAKRKIPPKESYTSVPSSIPTKTTRTRRLGTVAAVAAAVAMAAINSSSKSNTKSSHKSVRRRKKESKLSLENSSIPIIPTVLTRDHSSLNEEQMKHRKGFRKKIKRALKQSDKGRKS